MNILEYSVNGWYGTTFRATLLHPTKKKQEFQEDIYRLLRERGKEYLNETDSFPDNADWCEFILPDLLNLGYLEANIEYVTFSALGIIKDYKECDEWKSVVGEELFNLAAKKTKIILNNMYGNKNNEDS